MHQSRLATTGWKAVLQKRTWASWWTRNSALVCRVPLQQRATAGRGRRTFPSIQHLSDHNWHGVRFGAPQYKTDLAGVSPAEATKMVRGQRT